MWNLKRNDTNELTFKPDPAIVNDILSVTGISRARALYVGDSGVDMQTARNASVESAGVIWGFRDEEELRVNGADHIIHNAKDILKLTL